MNAFMLMMGGSGTRFGADRPKQYVEFEGWPLFTYILSAVGRCAEIDRIVLVSHADWLDYVREWTEKLSLPQPVDFVAGGENRSESVTNGLHCLAEHAATDDIVMIHDATHPYFDAATISAVAKGAKEFGGATLAARNYDTVYRVDENDMLVCVEPREQIVAGASPEAFRFGLIYEIYKKATDDERAAMTSAGAIALANDIPMKVVATSVLNLKVTYPDDMKLFRLLCKSYFFEDEA